MAITYLILKLTKTLIEEDFIMNKLFIVKEFLDQIKATQGSNAKMSLIKERLDKDDYGFNSALKVIVKLAYSKKYNYYIRKIPEPQETFFVDKCLTDENVYFQTCILLQNFNDRTLSGNKAKTALAEFRHELRMLDQTLQSDALLVNILDHDLRTGLGTTFWNKIFGADFLPKVPCMKAREMNEKNLANIVYPAWTQIKYDGTRLLVTITNEVVMETRNGSLFKFIERLRENIASRFDLYRKHKYYIDGELVFRDRKTGKLLDRKTSNGIASRCIKGVNDYDHKLYEPVYCVWDVVVDDNYDTLYNVRFDLLYMMFSEDDSFIVADYTEVANFDEVTQSYNQAIMDGEEGIILKNIHAPWSNNRSKHQIKFKEVIEVDLRAVEFIEGAPRTKHEGVLGAIVFKSDDGKISTKCGSGFDDETRKYIWDHIDEFKNKVATLKCNEIILQDESVVYSLFLPVIVEWRLDKDDTNKISDFI